MASNLVDSRRAGCRFVATLFVYFRRGREGRALVHTIQPSSLALSLATRLAPGTLGNRETPVEGGPRPGNERKWREGFRLLQWLRGNRLLVVPKAATKSECSRNDDCASK